MESGSRVLTSNAGAAAPLKRAALVILDLVSDFRFPDGEQLIRRARPVASRIAQLARRARKTRVPVIYVNDNAGYWNSDRQTHLARCLDSGAIGRDVVARIEPRLEDYFVFKPRHSAFYATPLEELLTSLAVRTLVLVGASSHQCVLFTAMDAHVRGYSLYVPRDCMAAPRQKETLYARFILEHAIGAHTPLGSSVRFSRLHQGRRLAKRRVRRTA